jgi:hypothetical protein
MDNTLKIVEEVNVKMNNILDKIKMFRDKG